MISHLDLFSGIGGFALAARMVGGIETRQFVEIEPYAQKVLKKHWPNVPIHEDVRTFTAEPGDYDLITAGFPCQDISAAGKGAGLAGERSGLFFEVVRIAGMVRPRYIVLENVAALISRGLDTVLGALTEAGYDTEWAVVSCADLGGCHRRERIWIVAYDQSLRRGTRNGGGEVLGQRYATPLCSTANAANPSSQRLEEPKQARRRQVSAQTGAGLEFELTGSGAAAHADLPKWRAPHSRGCGMVGQLRLQERQKVAGGFESGSQTDAAYAYDSGLEGRQRGTGGKASVGTIERPNGSADRWAQTQPRVCGNDDGLSARVDFPYLMPPEDVPLWLPYATDTAKLPNRKDRLKGLGNAVTPHQAAIPLQRVLELAGGIA